MSDSLTQDSAPNGHYSNGDHANGHTDNDEQPRTSHPVNEVWDRFGAAFTETTSTLNGEWLGDARVYEWQDEYGDVAPRDPELEAQLYNTANHVREGEHRQVLEIEVRVEGPERLQPMRKVCDPHYAFICMSLFVNNLSTVRRGRTPPNHCGKYQALQVQRANADSVVHHPSTSVRSRRRWHLANRYDDITLANGLSLLTRNQVAGKRPRTSSLRCLSLPGNFT
jgi:hypothetical protein